MLRILFFSALIAVLLGCGGGDSQNTPNKTTINNPPVANSDSINAGMNVSSVLDVLANDSDQDAFTLSSTTQPNNGSVIINSTNIIYTPSDGYVGSDSFSYTIKDSVGQEASTTVTLVIANTPPTTATDIAQTEQSSAVDINILANDVSVGGHELTITSTSVPSNGTIAHDGKLLTYTPTAGFVGEDSFIYIVEDSFGDESTATVMVKIINVLPVTISDLQEILQNEAITIDVLANDSDVLGDSLILTVLSGVLHGEARIEANKIVYTPVLGYAGNETITYTVTDNHNGQSQQNLTITVLNVKPVANDDIAYVEKGSSIAIDVLSNDHDVINDELTIQSVSAPQYGSVEIVEGKIVYQANADYIGIDVFGYTLVDSHGESDSGFITVTSYTPGALAGKLIGYEKAGLQVTIKVDDHEITTVTDEQGNYFAELEGALTPEGLVIVYVNDAASNYHLRAYLGGGATLLAAMTDDGIIHKNISDLTTAEYELIERVRNGSEATTAIELSTAQFDADNFYQLQMTIAIQLINAANGLNLPAGFASVNDFIKSTNEMSKQLSYWRENNNASYHQAFTSLTENSELSRYPERLDDSESFLRESAGFFGLNFSLGYTSFLTLSSSTNSYLSYLQELLLGSHQKQANSLRVSLDTAMEHDDYRYTYCGILPTREFQYFKTAAVEYTWIYSTPLYDVYLQKIETANELDFNCFPLGNVLYNAVRHYHLQPLIIESEKLYLNKLTINNEGEETQSYSTQLADLTLNNDNSFVDTGKGELTGSWTNNNGILQLNYSDGSIHKFYNVLNHGQVSQVLTTYSKNGQIKASEASYILENKPYTLQQNIEVLSYELSPTLDAEMNSKSRWLFMDDNTAQKQTLTDGEWSGSFIYSWYRDGNTYVVESYKLDEIWVDPCDISLPNCYIAYRDSFEILGEHGDVYQVKRRRLRLNLAGESTMDETKIILMTSVPK